MPASRNKSKKARLHAFIAERNLAAVTEPEWKQLLESLAPVSETYLRHLIAEAGIPVEQPYGGVRQKTFDELERSLLDMEQAYARARNAGNRTRAQLCRNAVIQAKDHARLAAHNSRSSPEIRAVKQEMVEWMLVWLENPGVFPTWVKLRRLKLKGGE